MSYFGTIYGTGQQQVLDSLHVALTIRQQPQQALVVGEGKEKSRKPIDPPPIVQIDIRPQIDPQRHFLVSPYLFMVATLLVDDEDHAQLGQTGRQAPSSMLGSLCSSLHRLKDSNNYDGGFFIFGDLSVRTIGTHRLRFALYDVSKIGENAAFITDVISDRFQVVASKDFHGMEESSALSRTFSDQGVRLRLRKEPRSLAPNQRRQQRKFDSSPPPHPGQMGHDRTFLPRPGQTAQDNAYSSLNEQHSDAVPRGLKRQRSISDYTDNAQAYPPSQVPRNQYNSYERPSSVYGGYGSIAHTPPSILPQYQSSSNDTHDYSVRPPAYAAAWQTALQQAPSVYPSAAVAVGGVSGEEHGQVNPLGPAISFGGSTNAHADNASTMSAYGSYSHAGQPMGTRTSSSSYGGGYDYRTPTSLTDSSGMASANDTSQLPSSAGTLGTGLGTTESTPVQGQQFQYGNINPGYASVTTPYTDASPGYTTSSQPQALDPSLTHSDAAHTSFGPKLPGLLSMPDMHNLPNMPNMLLGQGLPENFYQQDESSSYPTPTHSKPPGQWG